VIHVFQRHWHTTVRRVRSGALLDAQTVYRGTDGEYAALLQLQAETFRIVAATWESYAPELTTVAIEGLVGVEAYFNSGPVLKETLKELGEFPSALFAESVRGMIQSETFLLAERGFVSPEAYDQYWDEFYAGACRYYSNLDRVTQTWREHAGPYRTTGLFNRFKCQNVYAGAAGYRLTGLFSDSFHELGVDLTLDPNLTVVKAEAAMLRMPDKVCREAMAHAGQLTGLVLDGLSKKQIAALLGAGEGCVHLIDLVYDAMESLKIYRQKEMVKNNSRKDG